MFHINRVACLGHFHINADVGFRINQFDRYLQSVLLYWKQEKMTIFLCLNDQLMIVYKMLLNRNLNGNYEEVVASSRTCVIQHQSILQPFLKYPHVCTKYQYIAVKTKLTKRLIFLKWALKLRFSASCIKYLALSIVNAQLSLGGQIAFSLHATANIGVL